jgi:hypothetical protein
MTKARDIADFKFENIVDTGTEGTKVASGTTAQRGSTTGQWRYNSTTGFFEGRNASDFSTLEPTPTVSSVDDGEVDSAGGGNQTIVITGTNFTSGAVATFVGNAGANFDASTTTVDSATQITAVAPKSSFLNAQEPYLVKVSSASGVAGTSSTGLINVDNAPTWTTNAGSLGSIAEDATGNHFTVSASDAEGDTVSYSLQSGSLAGLSLDSSTGVISGDPTDVSSDTTNSFTLRATAGSKTTDRAFSYITTNPPLDGSTQARANTSASAIKTLTSTTTDGYYWIQASGMANPVRLWCDMNTDGGGYMRFWWFNTLEQNGDLNGSWQTGTKFGTADISTIPYNQYYGYGRIPSGVTPTKLLVKGTSGVQTSTNPPSHLIFTIDTNNSTSNNMLQSMQSGTTFSMAQGDNFPPTARVLDSNPYSVQSGGMTDHWGYNTNNLTGGSANESSFDLNDDTGRSNTTFSAGHDGNASGTDFVSAGSHPRDDNATGRYLIIYWK